MDEGQKIPLNEFIQELKQLEAVLASEDDQTIQHTFDSLPQKVTVSYSTGNASEEIIEVSLKWLPKAVENGASLALLKNTLSAYLLHISDLHKVKIDATGLQHRKNAILKDPIYSQQESKETDQSELSNLSTFANLIERNLNSIIILGAFLIWLVLLFILWKRVDFSRVHEAETIPQKRHSIDRRKLSILALISTLLVTGLGLILANATPPEKSWSPKFSTYLTDEYGTHAFYRLLKAEGFEVKKNYYPLNEENYGIQNYVLIGTPLPLSEEEKKQLLEEIEQGAILVYCPVNSGDFLDNLNIHKAEIADSMLGDLADEIQAAIPDRLFEYGDSLVYAPPPHLQDQPIRGMDALFNYHFTSDSLPIVPLLDANGEIHAGWVPYGEGKIYLFSNPYIFTNEGLRHGDNARFSISIFRRIEEEHRAPFSFDEYHHGYPIEKIATPLNEPEVRYMVWGLLLTFALAVFSFGLRTMKPVPVLNAPRRSMMEFISSVAQLYERQKGQSHIEQEIFHRFKSRVFASLEIPQEERIMGLNDLKTIAERKYGTEEGQELIQIFALIDEFTKQKGKKAVALVRRIREFSLRNKLDVHV